MSESINVNNSKVLSQQQTKEIIEACQRNILNKDGKKDSQEGIKILQKYFDKNNLNYDINKPLPGYGKWTALTFATFATNTDEIKALLTLGADPKQKIEKDQTVLHIAAAEGKTAICHKYLEKGVPVDTQTESGETPLMYACESGHLDVVKVFMPFKPNIMIQDNESKTCLDYALKNKHYNNIRYIEYYYIKNGIPIKKDTTPKRLSKI